MSWLFDSDFCFRRLLVNSLIVNRNGAMLRFTIQPFTSNLRIGTGHVICQPAQSEPNSHHREWGGQWGGQAPAEPVPGRRV